MIHVIGVKQLVTKKMMDNAAFNIEHPVKKKMTEQLVESLMNNGIEFIEKAYTTLDAVEYTARIYLVHPSQANRYRKLDQLMIQLRNQFDDYQKDKTGAVDRLLETVKEMVEA